MPAAPGSLPEQMDPRLPIAVIADSQDQQDQARQLAEKLGLPCSLPEAGKPGVFLALTGERVELRLAIANPPGPVYVDFTDGTLDFRRRRGGIRKEAIARAVGLRGNARTTVFDVTAGLGRDAFILASLGCRVFMFERSPVIAVLLEDGLRRGRNHPEIAALIDDRLQLFVGDSLERLSLLKNMKPEVVCIDPMYPDIGKSALAKKEMRLLRAVVGDDTDADLLLDAALKIAAKRVVVKRPRTAPDLAGVKPDVVVTGRSSRFDVYLVR